MNFARPSPSRARATRIAHRISGRRTGPPRSVLILQAGDALDDLGHGLSIPFEIRDLHPYRGFPPSTGGLVLAAIRARAARAPRAA